MVHLRTQGPRPHLIAAALTLAILTLAACSQLFKEPPGIVYAESVRQLGIYPVYPPREDLQVGDIYGVEVNAGADKSRLRNVYVDSIDLTAQIRDYLRGRYTFGTTAAVATPNTIINGVSGQVTSQADAPASGQLFDSPAMQNLPITGFPAIEVNSGLSLSLAAGSGSIGAAFGFGSTQTLKMRLNYGMVTSYTVPIPVADAAFKRYCDIEEFSAEDRCNGQRLTRYMNLKYQLGEASRDRVRGANVLMVSKVYLARAISYTFNDRSLAAAAASVANREENKQAVAPTINGSLLTSAMADKDVDMVNALAAFQTALNNSVTAAANNPNTEGATVSLATFTENSVTFEQIFQRPVVIGYEAVLRKAH
ncbi:MAG: hypothetical protein EOP22_08475 [Hyphomicrobiales bacterium]|nr:MAG: hypothetical protein EOP22_08475 [Hyphomicrobiales bacterium]